MLKGESQNTEYKQSWRDDYLKPLCAFANTDGGTLFIGVDDKKNVIGVQDAKRLQEDIPSKVKELLGIIPDVTLKKEKLKEYLCIKVKSYSNPISYKGKYYKRSGSTTQELNGTELHSFILKKSGMSWEDVVETEASISKDIDSSTVESFKQLAGKKDKNILKETSIVRLLEKLHLMQKGKLTRAAILLFGKDPQKYYPASYVKIGRFHKDATPVSMDEIGGNLFQQVEGVMEILKKKYLHSEITISSLQREEELEYPEVALREAIVNAIVHRDYSEALSQIKVYPDQLSIWNYGALVKGLTVEKLKKKHPSHLRNNRVAQVFFKASYIEAWGSGTVKMIEEFEKAGLPEPLYEEVFEGMQVTFMKDVFNEDNLHKLMLNDRQVVAMKHIKEHGRLTNAIYQQINSTSKRTATNDLQELAEKGLIEQMGATGKGTQYVLQRGNKGAKGAIRGKTALDKKLQLLEQELSAIDPNEEIKVHLNKKVFDKILDTWLSKLLTEFIIVGQKFNSLFNEPQHNIYLTSLNRGMAHVKFVNENPEDIVSEFVNLCKKEEKEVSDNGKVEFSLRYGTFKKGGLKTFGCNYSAAIEFDSIKYRVLLDEFTEGSMRSSNLQFERLLHKTVTDKEINGLAEKLGDAIYQHLDFYTKKNGLR